MTQTEKEALVLFKQYTFFQLKIFSVSEEMTDYEKEVVGKALEYWKAYTEVELGNKESNEGDQAVPEHRDS